MTSAVAIHEAGHVLIGLKAGRKLLRVWVRGKEGCVKFEPFRRRGELEATEEIPQLEATRGKDGKRPPAWPAPAGAWRSRSPGSWPKTWGWEWIRGA